MNNSLSPKLFSIISQQPEPITVAQLAVKTGYSFDELDDALEHLLEQYPCKLNANKKGELTYDFDFRRAKKPSVWEQIRPQLKKWGTVAYKSWVVIMIYAYVWAYYPAITWISPWELGGLTIVGLLILVAAFIYAVVADHLKLPRFLYSNYLKARKFLWGKRKKFVKYGSLKTHFHQRVFSFVFGEPYRGNLSQEEQDQIIVQYLSQNKGILTASELSLLTGLSIEEAETDIVRLMSKYRGEVAVSNTGQLLYLFPELPESQEEEKPWYIWQRLPIPQAFNDNFIEENRRITLLMGTLGLASAYSLMKGIDLPWGHIPILGSHLFPLSFSAIFAVLSIKNRLAHRRMRKERTANTRMLLLLRHFLSKEHKKNLSISSKIWKRLSKHLGGGNVEVGSNGDILFSLPLLEEEWENAQAFRQSSSRLQMGLGAEMLEEDIPESDSPVTFQLKPEQLEAHVLEGIDELRARNIEVKDYSKYVSKAENAIELIVPAYDVKINRIFAAFWLSLSGILAIIGMIVDSGVAIVIMLPIITGGIFAAISSIRKTNSIRISMRGKEGLIEGFPYMLLGPRKRFNLDNFNGVKIEANDDARTNFRMLFNIKKKRFPLTLTDGEVDIKLLALIKNELYEYLYEQIEK